MNILNVEEHETPRDKIERLLDRMVKPCTAYTHTGWLGSLGRCLGSEVFLISHFWVFTWDKLVGPQEKDDEVQISLNTGWAKS